MARRLLAAALAALLGLVVVEVGFRLFGPQPYARPVIRDDGDRVVDLGEVIGFFRDGVFSIPKEPRNGIKPGFRARFCYDRPRWDYFDANGCVEVSINSLGFRDEEFPLAKPAGELRLLAIGDSFTFAQGCRAEDGWTEVLEDLLADERGAPVQVMNAGFTGGGSWPQEYAPWVVAHALAFGPDRVVYGMCLNDMDRRVPMLAYQKVWDDASILGEPWLGGVSAVLNFLQRQRGQRRFIERRPPNIGDLLRADPTNWRANQEALRAIHAHLREAGVPFTIAVFPMLSLLGDGYPYAELHAEVGAFCEAEGIDYVDLYQPFHALADRELWVHPFDQHPAPNAHRLFAEGIFAHLSR
ncbi:MAG: GDSL-type esterase/lipase family protein [Planctomycetota bacterium]